MTSKFEDKSTGSQDNNNSNETRIRELKWTDDIVRGLNNGSDEEEEEEEEEECTMIDPFKDPDPTKTFSFHFSSSDDDKGIDIDLKGYKKEADQVWKSTGLTIWRAAEMMCHYMIDHSELVTEKHKIIELGAGLGLCGILAHIMSKNSDVCITDGDTDALKALRENLKHNRQKEGTVSCSQLLWGNETTNDFFQCNGQQKYDLILASDIVYTDVVIKPLWETVRLLLSQDGLFLFAYCSRRDVPVTIDIVLKASIDAGFSHDCVDERDGVLIYIFRWK